MDCSTNLICYIVNAVVKIVRLKLLAAYLGIYY